MATGMNDTPGPRSSKPSQDETSPIPLEFMLASALASRTQDETSPFLLEFQIAARQARRNQDETTPFLLELMALAPDAEPSELDALDADAADDGSDVDSSDVEASDVDSSDVDSFEAVPERTSVVRRSEGSALSSVDLPGDSATLPNLTWSGADAAPELREYAARIAAGESLPPYRGPLLAHQAHPRRPTQSLQHPATQTQSHRATQTHRAAQTHRATQSRRATQVQPSLQRGNDADTHAFLKFALAFIVLSAALVATAVLGDDAELRALGQVISGWFGGGDRSGGSFPLVEPSQHPLVAPCETSPSPALNR